jgi:hypothetical protein
LQDWPPVQAPCGLEPAGVKPQAPLALLPSAALQAWQAPVQALLQQ